jgi:hypothetical protein
MNALTALNSEEFIARFYGFAMPGSLRTELSQDERVVAFVGLYRANLIPDEQIKYFAQTLLLDFIPGQHFAHTVTLAALAVGLEAFATEFAQDFLVELARLECAEMQRAIHVARICLKFQVRVPSIVEKQEGDSISFSELEAGYDSTESNATASEARNSVQLITEQ